MWNRLHQVFRSPLAASLIVGLLASLGVYSLRHSGRLEFWELRAYDWSVRLQAGMSHAESRVVLIGITEEDVQALGQWPVTDAVLAGVLDQILKYRPRALGVGIYRSFPLPPGQADLEAILANHPNIVMVMKFGSETQTSVPPLPMLRDTEKVGFNDLLVDADGIIRRGLLFLDDGERTVYSFPLRLALLYLRKAGIVPQPDPIHPEHLRLGGVSFRPLESNDGGYRGADTRGYQILLDFQRAGTPFPTFPLTALLQGQVGADTVHDKVVLLGVMAESVPDVFHPAYSADLTLKRHGMYGVEIHAHIVDQLLRASLDGRAPIHTFSRQQETAWLLLWGLLGGGIGLVCRSPWRLAGLTTAGLLVLGLLVQLGFFRGWWIPLIPPALAWLSSSVLITIYMANQEKRQRAFLMQLFSRHVSPEVAEAIWQRRDQFWDGARPRSQKVMITVLFTDVEGFTAAAEKMDPQALMDWINTYTEAMAEVVMQHGGVVDDYFGDAIKANFGVPVPRTTETEIRQDAVNAVECALAMQEELCRLNREWQEEALPVVRLRVGIFTGPAVVGSQGSTQRLKYTTLSDTVNVAARLESLEKDSGDVAFGESLCRILIGESTSRFLEGRYLTQSVGVLALRGKEEKVALYRLVDRATEEPAVQSASGGRT